MTKAIRPFTAHTGSVGTATHSFLYGFIDNLSTLLFSTGSITASGTIACSNLSVANKAVSKIFSIMEGGTDLVYIDKHLAQFPNDLTVGRHATIAGDLEATTADILLTLQAKNATIEEIMQAGSVSSLGGLTAEGSSWLKGGLTVQGPASINTGGGLSASLTVNGPVSANSLSSGSSVSGMTGSFSTSVTSPTFNGNLSGTASNATYAVAAGSAATATNATNATNANYATTAGHASTADALTGGGAGANILYAENTSAVTLSAGVSIQRLTLTAGATGTYLVEAAVLVRALAGSNSVIDINGTYIWGFLNTGADIDTVVYGMVEIYRTSGQSIALTCRNAASATAGFTLYRSSLKAQLKS